MFEINYLNFISENFFNPQKRIFVGYIFSGFLIAFLWLVICKKFSINNSLKFIFDKKIYFSKSSKLDYLIYILNILIMLIFSPIFLSQLVIATMVFELMHIQNFFLPLTTNKIEYFLPFFFTFTFFILDDFSKFIVHMMMHKFEFFWSFHKVHHSAKTLTPMTVFRTHPVEGMIFIFRNAITQGIVIGFFYFISGGNLSLITIVGANVFSFIFHLTGSNLRHSHISISYWKPLEKIFISPAQHQIHHSIEKKHYDKNFGVTFAFWDLIFGSLAHSKHDQKIKFGLLNKHDSYNSLSKIYIKPITDSIKVIRIKITVVYKLITNISIVRKVL